MSLELLPGVWPHTLTCRCCLMPAAVTGQLHLEDPQGAPGGHMFSQASGHRKHV